MGRPDIVGIRDKIRELEEAKDKAVAFLRSNDEVGDAASMWISDLKELYYSIVAALQLLDAAARGDKKHAASANGFLEAGSARLAQCCSELQSLDADQARRLEALLRGAFSDCHSAIANELMWYLEEAPPVRDPKSIERVVRASDDEVQLPCSVCGEIAVKINAGEYRGITHRTSLGPELQKKVFALLDKGDLGKAHELVKCKRAMEDGMDAYCPDCNKIYCKKHYQVQQQYDEGYYDCSYGTCPSGHKRIIDD